MTTTFLTPYTDTGTKKLKITAYTFILPGIGGIIGYAAGKMLKQSPSATLSMAAAGIGIRYIIWSNVQL